MVNHVVMPSKVILFREKGFFLDEVAATGPPPEDYRIRGNRSIDDKNSANIEKNDDKTTTSNNTMALGSTWSESSSKDNGNEEDGISTDSSRDFAFFACWLYPYPVGCPSTDSDQE